MESLGCKALPIGAKGLSSFVAERYDNVLHGILQEVHLEHPDARLYLLVEYAIMDMSHIVGVEGFRTAVIDFLHIFDYRLRPMTK